MKKIFIMIFLIMLLVTTASAAEFTAPTVTGEAQEYMPEQQKDFGHDLLKILSSALQNLQPDISGSMKTCLCIVCAVILCSLLHSINGNTEKIMNLAGAVLISISLLESSNQLIRLGARTVTEISEYGKLLMPVLTAALAAQGGAASSVALYSGTMLFDTVLISVIDKLVVPMLFIYLCLCIANRAIGTDALENLRSFMKWLMTWTLKIILYIFTGYISITGVISGTADASAVKAAKLAISGAVPVVGSIVSDASETILVSAGVMKNAAGVYGVLAMLSILIGPFLKIGVQYIMLKTTAAVCGIFGEKQVNGLVTDFSGAMGVLLAMTGTVCLMQMISIVCFMKGCS